MPILREGGIVEEIKFSERFVLLEPSEQLADDKFDDLRVKLYCVADTKDMPRGQYAPLAYCRTWADGKLTERLLNFADAIREDMKVQISALTIRRE